MQTVLLGELPLLLALLLAALALLLAAEYFERQQKKPLPLRHAAAGIVVRGAEAAETRFLLAGREPMLQSVRSFCLIPIISPVLTRAGTSLATSMQKPPGLELTIFNW